MRGPLMIKSANPHEQNFTFVRIVKSATQSRSYNMCRLHYLLIPPIAQTVSRCESFIRQPPVRIKIMLSTTKHFNQNCCWRSCVKSYLFIGEIATVSRDKCLIIIQPIPYENTPSYSMLKYHGVLKEVNHGKIP